MFPIDRTRIVQKEKVSKTFQQILRITRAFFNSERRLRARSLSILLIFLAVASTGITVLTSYKLSAVMTSIEQKSISAFWPALALYLGSFVFAVLCDVYTRWAQDSLALLWREWMTQHLIKRYFNNRAYYRLRGSENIDNPDQRISEDVKNFTIDSLSYALLALGAVMDLIGFLGVLWAISGKLVALALIYAIFGTYICFRIGRRLVAMHYDKYQREANFRYGLVRVRDNAESIAFYRGEKREHLDLVRRLASVVSNLRAIIIWNRSLGFFRNSFDKIALLLPLVIVAPMFMAKQLKFGDVTQTLEAFGRVLAAVTLVSTNFEGLSSYLAGLQRLSSLWADLDDFDADELRIAQESEQQVAETGTQVKLDKLSIVTPGLPPKVLARDLSFELQPKESLLIMGTSGTGKSSVLRTIAGLWPSGAGALERPALDHLMFLPQRPYMVPGSLRDQLHYPYPDRHMEDDDIREVMERAHLSDVLARVDGDLDVVIDWSNVLSLGEQQRVAFARVFLRLPKFVFLDEATSALDEENQEHLYNLIKEAGIGIISVGHRTTLVPFHQRVLKLGREGIWKFDDI